MSASVAVSTDEVVPETTLIRSWKAPIALAVFAVLFAVLIFAAPRSGETTFRLSTAQDSLALPDLVVPVGPTVTVCLTVLVLLTALSAFFVRSHGRSPLWLVSVYILVAIVGFLTIATRMYTDTKIGRAHV